MRDYSVNEKTSVWWYILKLSGEFHLSLNIHLSTNIFICTTQIKPFLSTYLKIYSCILDQVLLKILIVNVWILAFDEFFRGPSISLCSQLSFTCSKSTIETIEVWNIFKVNNKNTRTTPMTFSGIFIVNFEHISLLFLVLLLLDLNK